ESLTVGEQEALAVAAEIVADEDFDLGGGDDGVAAARGAGGGAEDAGNFNSGETETDRKFHPEGGAVGTQSGKRQRAERTFDIDGLPGVIHIERDTSPGADASEADIRTELQLAGHADVGEN